MKRITILLLILFTSLTAATAWAGSKIVYVRAPNGTDDTVNIQKALDACVAYGPGCTVQLRAGHYFTKQLVEYNFHGTFKGMGIDTTKIEALPNLLVELEPVGSVPESHCRPNTTTCLWPTVILFVNGDIHVSDFSLYMTAPPGTATTTWQFDTVPYVGLFDGISFMGQYANVWVDRIHIEGRPDPTNPYYGFNVVNALHFSGEFPRSATPWDWYFLSGSFTVRNSSFSTAVVGISQDGFVKSSTVTIGGSPSAGNQLANGTGGIDIEASENSVIEVSYNQSSGTYAGFWVVPWQPEFVPTSPSQYFIHDNNFIGTEQSGDGMYLYDETPPFIQAAVWNNTIELQNTLMEGIGVYYTKGTAVWNNRVTGLDGYDGIGLWGTIFDAVANNNVSGFTVDSTSGLAQIYLDPSTTNDLVVCAERSDTVLNQGTNNAIIGCQQSTASAEAASRTAPSAPRPNLLRKKLQLPK